jgi:hypothetical protein
MMFVSNSTREFSEQVCDIFHHGKQSEYNTHIQLVDPKTIST